MELMNIIKNDAPVDTHTLDRPALRTLPEQLAEHIYADIIAGKYQPGERIREEALADAYGISRGPVREALRILERDSVVRLQANKGAHVTKLSIKEVDDIFEIRKMLAGAMARRLCSAPREVVMEFEPQVEALQRLAQTADGGAAYVAASVGLALDMARASGNERLSEVMRSLARQSWRYTRLGLATAERRNQSARQWRQLFVAVAAGRTEEAGLAMEKLVDESRQEAIRQLEREPTHPT